MNGLSPMNLSRRFLNVLKVGAVTTCSGNAFHGEITLDEKKFLGMLKKCDRRISEDFKENQT